ncbi:hypothetical protein BH09VER1_BH09VER1_42000 [soil metagenome]
MKKALLTLIAALSVATAVQAGDGKTFKETKTVIAPECLFRDQEFQIDAFYSGFFGGPKTRFGTGSGGGIGLNYFFCKYVGIGYEFQTYDNQKFASFLPASGNLFLRYPICSLNLAPYIMVGGGGTWSSAGGKGTGFGNVGAGLEYRITKNIGLFVDGRYFYGGTGNVADLRSGLRFAF